jgi:cob(I)alamin adenosyltransferase
MRLDRIYTKVGDKGKTLLATGEKVSKFDERIEAYGTVDELNSAVGVLKDHLAQLGDSRVGGLLSQIHHIQNELFDIGGELATPGPALNIQVQQVVTAESIARLEQEIDTLNAELPALMNFILPSGHPCVSFSHLARCICRRAERATFRLQAHQPVRNEVCIYLNRLSDWLFVAGRAIGHKLGIQEVLWQQRGK